MENSLGSSSCIAVEIDINLEEFEEKKISLILGEEENEELSYLCLKKFQDLDTSSQYLKETKEYWNSILRSVQVKTGYDEIDFMLNRLGNVSDDCM